MSDVLNKVVDIVCEQLGADKGDVKSDSSFVEDLGADSLDTVELVMAFEEEFGLDIPDEEAEKITTIQSAVDWIESNSQKTSFFPNAYFSFVVTSLNQTYRNTKNTNW